MSLTFQHLAAPLPSAVLLTLANAFKPLVVDDTAYVLVARHLVDNPLHIYGSPPRGYPFLWYQEGQGAFTLLMPPVLPYWIALEIRLFGDEPVLWKLGLFPFCWLFTAGLYALLRRFAPGWERRLLLLTVISPTFLPSLNLMLDLPAIGLAIAAVAVFMHALDRNGRAWRLLIVAGLLAGLGMQTKYTAVTAPVVMLWYGLLHRRFRAAFLSAGIALGVFAAWELYIGAQFGQSHFVFHASRRYGPPPGEPASHDNLPLVSEPYPLSLRLEDKSRILAPLFGYLGGLGPAFALLLWYALHLPRWAIRAGLAFVCVGFAAIVLLPLSWTIFIQDGEVEKLSVNGIVMGWNGIAFLVGGLVASAALCFRGCPHPLRLRRSANAWFLAGWFAIELGGYLAMSPFGAARRVMGLMIATTVLAGYLLARTDRSGGANPLVRSVIGLGLVLGIGYWAVDFAEAFVEKRAAQASAEWIRRQPDQGGVRWFTGHWGFRFYATRAGMWPVWPERSVLHAGDWLVIPDPDLRPYSQRMELDTECVQPVLHTEWSLPIPVRTMSELYGGATPVRKHEGPRMRVTIYLVRKDFLARTP